MNIFQRLRTAFQIAPLIPDNEVKQAVATRVEQWKIDKPEYPETNFYNLVTGGWRRNELIYACVNKTAHTSSQVELKVYEQESGDELQAHPVKALIQAPNPFMSESDFWAAIVIYQKFAGRAAFEIEFTRGGIPARLWPLRPDWLYPLPSNREMIGGYEYCPPGLPSAVLKPFQVLDFKLFDPLNQYHAWPPVAVASRVGTVDNEATDHIKAILQSGGVPPGILTSKQKLVDSQVVDIRRRWRERYGGWKNNLEPAVLDSDASYQKTGFDFQELGYDFIDSRNEARICMCIDIPPILVGAKVGLDRSTYSNYKEARSAWWEDSLIPLYSNHSDVIFNQLVKRHYPDEKIKTEWDYSRVPALRDDQDALWKRASDAFRAGALTLNEFYEQVGEDGIGPAGDIYLRSVASIEVPQKTGRPVPVVPEPVEDEENEETEDMEAMDEESAGMDGMKFSRNGHDAGILHDHKARKPPNDATRRKVEGQINDVMGGYLERQFGAISAAVKDRYKR